MRSRGCILPIQGKERDVQHTMRSGQVRSGHTTLGKHTTALLSWKSRERHLASTVLHILLSKHKRIQYQLTRQQEREMTFYTFSCSFIQYSLTVIRIMLICCICVPRIWPLCRPPGPGGSRRPSGDLHKQPRRVQRYPPIRDTDTDTELNSDTYCI